MSNQDVMFDDTAYSKHTKYLTSWHLSLAYQDPVSVLLDGIMLVEGAATCTPLSLGQIFITFVFLFCKHGDDNIEPSNIHQETYWIRQGTYLSCFSEVPGTCHLSD